MKNVSEDYTLDDNGKNFKNKLKDIGLTVNQFLDLRDQWNKLSGESKYILLKEEYNK